MKARVQFIWKSALSSLKSF